MKWLIYINVIVTWLHIPTIVTRLAFAQTDEACDMIAKIGTVVFHISRCSLYVVLIRRLQVSYKDSIHQLSKCQTISLYTIIALYFFPYVFYIDWTIVNGSYDE